jgi:hypothetical protein
MSGYPPTPQVTLSPDRAYPRPPTCYCKDTSWRTCTGVYMVAQL